MQKTAYEMRMSDLSSDIAGGDPAPGARADDDDVIFVRKAVGVQDMLRVDLAPVDWRQRHVIVAALTEGGKREADLPVHRLGGVGLLIAGLQPRLPPEIGRTHV